MTRDQTRLSNMVQLFGLLAAFTAGLLSPWCYGAASKVVPYTRREIARRVSPDETQDAVMIEVQPRYMSDDVTYEVQIWKHAMPNGATPPVFTATHAAGFNLRWIAADLLEIEYRHALIDQFTDHWSPCRDCGQRVEIHLALP
jgi:hypothetical protein